MMMDKWWSNREDLIVPIAIPHWSSIFTFTYQQAYSTFVMLFMYSCTLIYTYQFALIALLYTCSSTKRKSYCSCNVKRNALCLFMRIHHTLPGAINVLIKIIY